MAQTLTSNNVELKDISSPAQHSLETDDVVASRAESQELSTQSLPPCDRGRAAWSLLLATFVFEALLWGFPLSFGVFQAYYSQLPQFANNPYISVIGTTASGISYLAAPIAIPLTKRFSKYRRHMIYVGWPLCIISLVAGSFAKSLETLILTQGVMYGIGFIIFYYPILSFVNEFWIERRGMAYGFVCSASGVSGAVMPLCLRFLLQRYGYPTTLRAIAVGLFITTGPLIPFLKGRVPQTETGALERKDWAFLRRPLFWGFTASNFAMGLGYFFPSLYLPSYASLNGMNATKGALLLTVMSISQVVGQLTFGYLSDRRVPVSTLTVSSALISGIAVYTCWGLSHQFGPLLVFSMIYGFFAAGYTALWARMASAVASEPTSAFTAFGLFNFGKGVGNILAGPIGGTLLTNAANVRNYGSTKYGLVVLFTGSCMLLSAITMVLSNVNIAKLSRFLSS